MTGIYKSQYLQRWQAGGCVAMDHIHPLNCTSVANNALIIGSKFIMYFHLSAFLPDLGAGR